MERNGKEMTIKNSWVYINNTVKKIADLIPTVKV